MSCKFSRLRFIVLRDIDRAKGNCFVKIKTNSNCLKVCFQIYLAMKISVVYCSRGSTNLSITVIHYVVFNVYFVRLFPLNVFLVNTMLL